MSFRKLLQHLQERPLVLWLLLWLATTALYLPAWKGGFQQDFQGWMELYYDHSFRGMLNREAPSVHSFYQLTQLQLYLLTTLFGTHPLPWFLLFTGLHALNGCLFFRLSRQIFLDFGSLLAAEIALAGTLLAMFNPSMTEVVLWKASYHYFIAMQGILWTLLWTRNHLLTGNPKYIWRSAILLAALSFTLELWYTIPLLALLISVVYRWAAIIPVDRLRRTLSRLVAPLFAILAIHLSIYRLTYGTWLAHAAFSSPGDDSVPVVAARVWSYEWHLLGFGRFFPNTVRQIFYRYTGSEMGGILALAAAAVAVEYCWRRFRNWPGMPRAIALFAGLSAITLLVVLHYIPPDIFVVNNDRYLYVTAFFQWTLIAALIFHLFRSIRMQMITWSLVMVLCIGFTVKLVFEWRSSTKVFWAMQDKFIWKDAPLVLILNMPATLNGIGIIRGGDTSELPAHLHVYGKGTPRGFVSDVSSYNMVNPWDGAHVIVEDSTHLHVIFNQWGSWWQLYGLGANDRSNRFFDLRIHDGGHDYYLTLKQRPPGMVILYQQGQEWRVVDMNKPGVEQW